MGTRRLVAIIGAIGLAGLCLAATPAGPAAAQTATQSVVGRLVALPATRILDTGQGIGAVKSPIAGQHKLVLQLLGRGGVPLGGVSTVLLQVTVTSTQAGSLTATPDTIGVAGAPSIAFTANAAASNLVVAAVPADGRLDLFNNSAGAAQVSADVTGYVLGDAYSTTQTDFTNTAADGLVPQNPATVPIEPTTIPAGGSIPIFANNRSLNQGLSAIALQVTVDSASSAGFLTVTAPVNGTFSDPVLRFGTTLPVSNTFVFRYSGGPRLYNSSAAPVQLRAQLVAAVTATDTATPSTIGTVDTARLLDSSVPAGATVRVEAGSSVPADASAVLIQVDQSGSSAPGTLTAWASGQARPSGSLASFGTGVPTENFGVIPLGNDHAFQLWNNSSSAATVQADVYGYLRSPGTPTAAPGGLGATATDDSVTLNFAVPAGAAKVLITRLPGRTPPGTPAAGQLVAGGSSGTATDTGLATGTPYSYSAFSMTADGAISAASSLTVTTTGATAPGSTGVGYLASTLDPAGALGPSVGFDLTSTRPMTTSELVAGGTDAAGNGFTIDLKPPAGSLLHAGFYPGVTDLDSPVAGHAAAGFELDDGNRDTEADVEIRDLAADSSGAINRLDLVFREAPDADGQYTYGEIRFGQGEPAGYTVSARAISIADNPIGSVPVGVPVWIHDTGTAPVTIGTPATSGPEYQVVGNDCAGQVLQPSWSCSITVTQRPDQPGPRTGTLSVPVNGHNETVQLDSYAPAGRTELIYGSGGYIGGVDLPDRVAQMHTVGNGSRALFFSSTDGDTWQVAVSAPTGQRLATGSYQTGGFGSTNGWGLDATAPGKSCSSVHGSMVIKQLALAADGTPLRADISFTQYCDDVADPMSGELSYRIAADTSAPRPIAAVVVSGTGSTRTVSWANPCIGDYAYTAVRLYAGSTVGGPAQTGYAIYSGAGQSAVLTGLRAGQAYTIAAYPVDPTGNVGAPTVGGWTAAQARAKSNSCGYIASSRAGRAVYINGLVKQWGTTSVVPAPNRTIWLQRYINGGWQRMLSRVTNSSGRVTVGFVSTTARPYRWCVIASGTAAAITTGTTTG